MDRNGQIRQKNRQKRKKQTETNRNGQRQTEMDRQEKKRTKTDRNKQKHTIKVRNRQKQAELKRNGQRLTETDKQLRKQTKQPKSERDQPGISKYLIKGPNKYSNIQKNETSSNKYANIFDRLNTSQMNI